MTTKEKEKLVKEIPLLKGHTMKCREKIGDSFMAISNNMWSILFVSIVALPLGGIFNSFFSEKPFKPTYQTISEGLETYGWVLVVLFIIAISLAILFRSKALKIYDSLKN